MRVLTCALATTKTDPPCPPSPPLGPPRGTRFSRRNARHPRPPCPAATWMSTSSTNKRKNADDAAARAVVLEADAAVDLREDRVVLAPARVQSGPEATSALPHDDGAAGHHVAVVSLHAEALRIGIAPVARAALPLFVS